MRALLSSSASPSSAIARAAASTSCPARRRTSSRRKADAVSRGGAPTLSRLQPRTPRGCCIVMVVGIPRSLQPSLRLRRQRRPAAKRILFGPIVGGLDNLSQRRRELRHVGGRGTAGAAGDQPARQGRSRRLTRAQIKIGGEFWRWCNVGRLRVGATNSADHESGRSGRILAPSSRQRRLGHRVLRRAQRTQQRLPQTRELALVFHLQSKTHP